jgi:Peptidase family S41
MKVRVAVRAFAAVALVAIHSSMAASAPQNLPWAEIATADLEMIHRTLLNNHVGPVDLKNPRFVDWLDGGFHEALGRAQSARNFFDYKRALLSYINGFRDGHTNIVPAVDSTYYEWPGFLPGLSADGAVRVGVSEQQGIDVGDTIVSCDGIPIEQLFATNVAPFYWNRDVSPARALQMPRTFMIDAGDEKVRTRSCVFSSARDTRQVELQWRRVPRARGIALRSAADGRVTPELGLHAVEGIWFLSFPSFDYQSGADVVRFRAVLDDIAAHADELRNASRVVIDVRGNTGGMSAWGESAAASLWGQPIVQAVRASLPGDVDWRASKANYDYVDKFVRDAQENGIPASNIAEMKEIKRLISQALSTGEDLAHEPSPVKPLGKPLRPTFPATVYFLTDGVCTSACLDFADVVLRLPNVIHIGRPTDADALYIDTNHVELPSALGIFQYSMKVFRTRVRGNNQWYEPAYRWPGGIMTDKAIAEWVKTLPTARTE